MTKELINIESIYEANEKLKGTNEYNKYYTEKYSKINGKWCFMGMTYPYETTATIKTYKDTKYLMTNNGESRYKVNETIAELLNL